MQQVFIVILIASSAMLGNAIARSVGEKEKVLRDLLVCLKCMRAGMLYQQMSMYEAFVHAKNAGLEGFFGECAEIIKKKRTAQGREIVLLAKQTVQLPDEAKNLLMELCDMLCVSVTKSDVEDAFSHICKNAVQLLKDRSETSAKRAKLSRSLCFAGGLALAIIIA